MTLRTLPLAKLQEFFVSLESQGLKPATRARALGAVSSLLSFGTRLGYLSFNLSNAVPEVRGGSLRAEKTLTREEVSLVFGACSNTREKALLHFMYCGGLRVSEVVSLKWSDLMRVEAAEESGVGEGIRVSVLGKGNKQRWVFVPVLQELEFLSKSESGFLFESEQAPGKALRAETVFRIVKSLGVKAGIAKDLSPHWFRHSFATHSLENGCPLHELRDAMGHASIATTDRYLGLSSARTKVWV